MVEEKKEVKETKRDYKLLQVTTLQQLKLFIEFGLLDLIENFVKKANNETTVDKTLGFIANFLTSPYFRFYVVINGQYKPRAYYIIQIAPSDENSEIQAFVYQHDSADGMLPEINKQLEDILRSQEIKKIKFITKRDDRAFAKLLDPEWKITGVVFEKKL